MIRHIWRWLFGGYTCDVCKCWAPRRRGRAHVKVERRGYQVVRRNGAVSTQSYRVVVLRCPGCAAAWIERTARKALLAVRKRETTDAVV